MPLERLVRTAGFGAALTRALGIAMGLDDESLDDVAMLGAFDTYCDTKPDSIGVLRDALGAGRLAAMLGGDDVEVPRGSDAGIRSLLSLISQYFQRCRDLARHDSEVMVFKALSKTLREMLEGQLVASESRRSNVPPTAQVLNSLRSKSATPIWHLALLCMLKSEVARSGLRDLRQRCMELGTVLWVADDLVDMHEDWNSGCWSRPWVLWALRGGEVDHPGVDFADALNGTIASGVVDAEATAIARALANAAVPWNGAGEADSLQLVLETLAVSWACALPTP